MDAEDYEHAHITADEAYTGVRELDVAPELVAEAYGKGSVTVPTEEIFQGLCPHQYVVLRNEVQPGQAALTRHDARDGTLHLVTRHKEGAWGILPRNREQIFALDALLDDNLPSSRSTAWRAPARPSWRSPPA